MNNRQKILWITNTSVLIALLVIAQSASASLGQYVTGSLVNFILIASLIVVNLPCSVSVAILAPISAFFLGIGVTVPPIIPLIILGNVTIVLVWYFVLKLIKNKRISYWIALMCGALAKFVVLFFGIVKILIPLFLNLPEKQVSALTIAFGYTQIITALIGGFFVIIVAPRILKIRKN